MRVVQHQEAIKGIQSRQMGLTSCRVAFSTVSGAWPWCFASCVWRADRISFTRYSDWEGRYCYVAQHDRLWKKRQGRCRLDADVGDPER